MHLQFDETQIDAFKPFSQFTYRVKSLTWLCISGVVPLKSDACTLDKSLFTRYQKNTAMFIWSLSTINSFSKYYKGKNK